MTVRHEWEIPTIPEPYASITGKINFQIDKDTGASRAWWSGGDVIGINMELMKDPIKVGQKITIGPFSLVIEGTHESAKVVFARRV